MNNLVDIPISNFIVKSVDMKINMEELYFVPI